MINAKIIADSKSPRGHRLTTFELEYPRFIHAEFMTHRMFSRNAQSNRAIPTEKLLERANVKPIHWGQNQRGMVAERELDFWQKVCAEEIWDNARRYAIDAARTLASRGVHKQVVNRLLEPFQTIKVICSGTDAAYANFFRLRCAPDAQPEIRALAYDMRAAYDAGWGPSELGYSDWHLPLVLNMERKEHPVWVQIALSVARCARVSYLTHDGKRDVDADLRLYSLLKKNGHASPFEHVARPKLWWRRERTANFTGWVSHRVDLGI